MSTSHGENNTTVNEELKHPMQAFTLKAPDGTHVAGYYNLDNTNFYINQIMKTIPKKRRVEALSSLSSIMKRFKKKEKTK